MHLPRLRFQIFGVLFIFLIFSSVVIECTREPVHHTTRRKATGSLDAFYGLLGNVQKVLSNLLGSQADNIINEFYSHVRTIETATDVLESLRDPNVINSINEFIGTVFTGLEEAIESNRAGINKDPSISAELFSSMIMTYQKKLVNVVEASRGLPQPIKVQLLAMISSVFASLSVTYSEIVKYSGLKIPSFLFVQYLPIILEMKKHAKVSVKTFEHISNVKEELHSAFEDFINQYLSPDRINMLNFLLTMVAQNMPKAHDEL